MALDAQFEAMLGQLADAGTAPLSAGTPEEARAGYRALSARRRGEGWVPEAVASVADRSVDGPGGPIPVRVYTPAGVSPGSPAAPGSPVVVYAHGGGWVLGDLDSHDPVCRRVANALGAEVVSVDYRLAPEHPYPAALDDVVAVVEWAAAAGAAAPGTARRPLGVAGDSAGASLAAGAALAARDAGLRLDGQLLLYPATDPTLSSPSYEHNASGYFLTRDDMAWFWQQYLGADSVRAAAMATKPAVDLLHADVAGVAPAVVATAEYDPLRDDGASYAARLADAGVAVTHLPGPGLIHGWFAFLGQVGAAEAAGREALAAFGRLLGG